MLIEIDDSVMMALKNENPNDEHVILYLYQVIRDITFFMQALILLNTFLK